MISICFLTTPTMLRVIICATTPIPPRTICRSKNDLSKQVRSPGIIFVVEAEAFSVDIISNTDTFKKRFSDALTDKGFNLVGAEAISIQEGEKSIVSIVLREGYVIARAMAENKYCGFDIHFWSSLDKHEAAKDALVAAVESKAPALTSYR